MKNKETIFRRAIAVLGIAMFLACSRTYVDNGTSENTMKNLISNPVPQTVIEIYTYGDEHYRAIGNLDVINNEKDSAQYVLELQGRLERVRGTERVTIKNQIDETSTVLTVYEGENIYGFYSNKKIDVRKDGMTTNIVMYGYLEAYCDGSVFYSG